MNTSKKPLVSVIVPVYNVEGYLDECLNSIKQQTYKHLEIIVVEDCSTDSSMTVLQAHLADTRFKLIPHEKNRGISAARNTGIEAATGDYLMFVDSDDIIDTRLIAACVNCAITTNADLVTYGFSRFIDGTHPIESPDFSDGFSDGFGSISNKVGDEYFSLEHFAWLKFIRSSVLKTSHIRFLESLYYEDWPFHWHVGLSIKNRYQLLVDLYFYRQRGTSITGSKGQELLDVFTVQRHIISLLQQYKANTLKNILINKSRRFNFYIITFINPEFLESALSQVREVETLMQKNSYKGNVNYQSMVIATLARAPSYIAFPALQIFRHGLHKIILPIFRFSRNRLKILMFSVK